jgi:hypothetical protein
MPAVRDTCRDRLSWVAMDTQRIAQPAVRHGADLQPIENVEAGRGLAIRQRTLRPNDRHSNRASEALESY